MGMNPDTNRFEMLQPREQESALLRAIQEQGHEKEEKTLAELTARLHQAGDLLRPNGEPVPKHWTVVAIGENVVVKNYTFKVVHLGEGYMVLEPVGSVIVGQAPE